MTLALSILALISSIVTIWAKIQENESLQFVFKPLTMLAIILLAFFNSSAPMSFYEKAILAGLIFSTVGDVLLIKDKQYFVQGLIAFLIGHIFYIAAFWTNPNWLSGLLYLSYIVFFFSILWKHLGSLKIPVIVYAIALALMSWMALSGTIENHNHHTFHAFIGSVLFIVSDTLLAYNKFKTPISYAPVWILATYFLAQWFIALSL